MSKAIGSLTNNWLSLDILRLSKYSSSRVAFQVTISNSVLVFFRLFVFFPNTILQSEVPFSARCINFFCCPQKEVTSESNCTLSLVGCVNSDTTTCRWNDTGWTRLSWDWHSVYSNVKNLFVSVRHPHDDNMTKSTFDKMRLLLRMTNLLINKLMFWPYWCIVIWRLLCSDYQKLVVLYIVGGFFCFVFFVCLVQECLFIFLEVFNFGSSCDLESHLHGSEF